MPRDFYPRREAEIVSFTGIFRRNISEDPLRWGFSTEDAARYAQIQQAFAQKYALVHDNSTDSSSAYTAKEMARVALEKATRSFAAQVKGRMDVSDAMLQTLGLARRGPRRQRVGVPDAPPILRVVETIGSELRLQIFDAESTRRGKPRDVSMVAIYGCVSESETPPATRDGFRLMKYGSRANGVSVRFDQQLPPGTKVWLTAAWSSPRGEQGPGCAPVYTYLGHSGPLAAAKIRAAA